MIGLRRLLIVAAGGALGAAARYWVSGFVQRLADSPLPWGTAAVNLSGSFLIGFIMTYGVEITTMATETRLFLVTGILGGFTTFSALSYESLRLFQEGSLWLGFGNLALNVLAGLLAVFLGVVAARIV